jgi:hypothetical protein
MNHDRGRRLGDDMVEMDGEMAGQIVGGIVKALTDKHGQMDIRLKGVQLSWKGTPLSWELNGAVTVSLHLRDLTEKEKQAHRDSNLAAIKG